MLRLRHIIKGTKRLNVKSTYMEVYKGNKYIGIALFR